MIVFFLVIAAYFFYRSLSNVTKIILQNKTLHCLNASRNCRTRQTDDTYNIRSKQPCYASYQHRLFFLRQISSPLIFLLTVPRQCFFSGSFLLFVFRGIIEFIKRVGKSDKMRGMNVRFYLSYDISIPLKLKFWHENAWLLPYIHDIVMEVIS